MLGTNRKEKLVRAHDYTPLVSVAMITYNHERFVTKAIDSVLAQKTTFPIELIIGDDASTDSTGQLIEALKSRSRDTHIVHPMIHSKNVGMHKNLESVLALCRGEFVAFLEGDDYWTSANKLQFQLTRLMKDPGAVGVFHRV